MRAHRRFGLIGGLLVLAGVSAAVAGEVEGGKPNVLFIIADDASRHFGQAYHCDWVKTPNIDRLASEGLAFDNAYVPTSKCAPCRAAILTGRNPWQIEEAANHQHYFPAKYMAFSEALERAGVKCGSSGKVWGPGVAKTADGSKRTFALAAVTPRGKTPGETFATFLKSRPAGTPFFYWYGSTDPHRPYELGAGIAAGKRVSDIDRVPAYWPDNETVRGDMLDYAMEVERFDEQIGSLLAVLEESGEAHNTLVIVTSDNGMPFPRVKGHTYDEAHHLPLVARWPAGIANPGRRVRELVSAIDLAPTFLEVFGVDGVAAGMAPLTGRSLTDLLRESARIDRSFVLIGRERNDVFARPGSPHGLGYPVRAIRAGNLLYIRNFAPDRWPCGDEHLGFLDTDASPTKKLIQELGDQSAYWQHAFGKRPEEQLFDIEKDPDCVKNLADDLAYAESKASLRETLMTELKTQNDPRVLGQGDVFDNYESVKALVPGWEKGQSAPAKKARGKDQRK